MRIYIIFVILIVLAAAQKDPHFWKNRNGIVHLFEWKWIDIATECENFLSKKGFGGVQISPPSENAIVAGRPWWEKYQPVSYILNNRAGDETTFLEMTRRCNNAGIRIYVDLVVNHMAVAPGRGTANSTYNTEKKSYPAVPYTSRHFHPSCGIDYNNAESIRNCELVGLKDLDQSQHYVREKIIEYVNHLIDLGVAGFRVDAAKHMWPNDLEQIFSSVKYLNTAHGFPNHSRAFIYQEVINIDDHVVNNRDYLPIGRVCEFKNGHELAPCFNGHNPLKYLKSWGTGWGLLEGPETVIFIENHDTERGNRTLSYKNAKPYKAAIGFMFAHPYDAVLKIMSSYFFDNNDQAPPHVGDTILSPGFSSDGTCTNGWVCQHRWSPIFNMIEFRNTVDGTDLNKWWDNGDRQIAFSRGNRGFYAVTVYGDINTKIPTSLPDGSYCDIISGSFVKGKCTGKTLNVSGGYVHVYIGAFDFEAAVATHINAKIYTY
ncbi:hypothetical protein GWI33_004537 [Rhynchophorus ferrugineus]|uniref:Alpha-amylase n=1 Tax=Rhynchophorus ferrugineus TaxID=354439 RepID=A0A834IKN5_RHYFE|nr:hypothetical protein GWI33_004537 [Rhynchophorus ferrugineus]